MLRSSAEGREPPEPALKGAGSWPLFTGLKSDCFYPRLALKGSAKTRTIYPLLSAPRRPRSHMRAKKKAALRRPLS